MILSTSELSKKLETDLEFKLRVLNREIEKVSEVGRRLTSAEALNIQDFQAILEDEQKNTKHHHDHNHKGKGKKGHKHNHKG